MLRLRLLSQSGDRRRPLAQRFPDADQETCRVGHVQLARPADVLEACRRLLVGTRPVRLAALQQSRRELLQHQALTRADSSQLSHLLPAHDPRVEVRQQARLFQHAAGYVRQVLHSRLKAEPAQLLAGDRVASLGLVAQREQRFRATGLGGGPSQTQDLLLSHVGPRARPGRLGERAVATVVAAELRQWQEDLGRIGDAVAVAFNRQPVSGFQQRLQRLGGAEQEGQHVRVQSRRLTPQLVHAPKISLASRLAASLSGISVSVIATL